MEKYLIRYTMRVYPYMGTSYDRKEQLIFVTAVSEADALYKLKEAKEYSSPGGDSAAVHEHEFIESIV